MTGGGGEPGSLDRADVRGERASRGRHTSSPGSPLDALLKRWRTEADVLRRRGAITAADALASCADDLAEALHRHALEEISVAEAARETGYSPSALRRRFPGRKTIPRAALPQKGARVIADGPDLAGE